ncbi:hypothetical protein HAPG_00075 [Halorubrum phage GNf2]|nr:hypothetical protein HAPG_00075 [Halorubrum phage GNf2]
MTALENWYQSHRSDYAQTEDRLDAVRNVVLNGRTNAAADILERAYMFAVLSIQTERSRHENAFVGHYTGNLTRKEAALETVYGGNKLNWIRRTFEKTSWKDLALAVRTHAKNGRFETLLDVVVETVVGVSYRKAGFMLAMSGLTEFMCIDSNVARYAGLDGDNMSFNSAESYMAKCREICDGTGIDADPFVTQWAVYDYERGEHARHMTYFNEIL